ncbi:murein DD-endopeptidase MepM and murein hydrolase activator NlpD [Lentimicrobium saccharophilum]|uniref:Murein DD-endopeptidase MepM and murein hydrolase activator NlpD n=1 Tax=Lentimicrobium saccharophilum TaxID=1678841 RepID=A0A0S7BZI2_9BACT|nr:murein DD-endopeptidase MepM and murein hydrolase activator NlpD [Lentimicrobium saccharophilum]
MRANPEINQKFLLCVLHRYFCMLYGKLYPFFRSVLDRSGISFRYQSILTAFLLLAVLPPPGFAQSFTIDTSAFLNEEREYLRIQKMPEHDAESTNEEELLTEEDGDNFVPEDMIFVPSDVLYNNRWDTLYIRTGRIDAAGMSDSVLLLLNNPAETPFAFPHKGKLISKYGQRGSRFHAGMDIKLETGDTVVSAFDGKVRIARVMSGYGKMVVIRHHNGLETVYSHLSKILVNINQEVKAGEPVGLGGRTGRASTTHLHFETRFRGEHFNPGKIIDFENYTLRVDTLLISKEFWSLGRSASSLANDGTASSGSKYHTIRSGDTLSKIARRYGTTVNQLCRINGIKPTKVLRIGSRIRVA